MSFGEVMQFVAQGILIAAVMFVLFRFFQAIRLVSTQTAHVVERLGVYKTTLEAGFHALVPFIDRVTNVLDLREEAIDVPPQECFTMDEVQVIVDGVIYMQVMDPVKATYGITDYRFAAVQLAKTTTRSVIGTLDLDRTFEERDVISAKVVSVLDAAGELWGIRVHRYEIKNLAPPDTVKYAMEKQVNAERERRAILAASEGQKQAAINRSEGEQLEAVNRSEGDKQRRINEAEGRAAEILSLAAATADSITKIASVVNREGGRQELELQLKEKYIATLSELKGSKVILPANLVAYEGWVENLGLDKQP